MKEFYIHFDDGQMDDLRRRIDNTRLPMVNTDGWELGTDSGYLSGLLDYWRNKYDWPRKERELILIPI